MSDQYIYTHLPVSLVLSWPNSNVVYFLWLQGQNSWQTMLHKEIVKLFWWCCVLPCKMLIGQIYDLDMWTPYTCWTMYLWYSVCLYFVIHGFNFCLKIEFWLSILALTWPLFVCVSISHLQWGLVYLQLLISLNWMVFLVICIQ